MGKPVGRLVIALARLLVAVGRKPPGDRNYRQAIKVARNMQDDAGDVSQKLDYLTSLVKGLVPVVNTLKQAYKDSTMEYEDDSDPEGGDTAANCQTHAVSADEERMTCKFHIFFSFTEIKQC